MPSKTTCYTIRYIKQNLFFLSRSICEESGGRSESQFAAGWVVRKKQIPILCSGQVCCTQKCIAINLTPAFNTSQNCIENNL